MSNWTYIKLSKDQFINLFDNFVLAGFSFTHVEYFTSVKPTIKLMLQKLFLDVGILTLGIMEYLKPSQVFTNNIVFTFPG